MAITKQELQALAKTAAPAIRRYVDEALGPIREENQRLRERVAHLEGLARRDLSEGADGDSMRWSAAVRQ